MSEWKKFGRFVQASAGESPVYAGLELKTRWFSQVQWAG